MASPRMRGRSGWRDERRIGPNIHPTPPVKYAIDGPDGQKTRKRVQKTANEKCCWHFGHAMVTYALIP